jgi:hypothetical protein
VRIEIQDNLAVSHVIDSADYDLIGRWLAEKARLIMSADARYNHPVKLDIWPSAASARADEEVMRQADLPIRSGAALLELVRGLLELSAAWGDS